MDTNESEIKSKLLALWDKGAGIFTVKVWLIMLTFLGILIAVAFLANSFQQYQVVSNNARLAGDLKKSQEQYAALQKVTTESLTALQNSKEQLSQETNLRLAAEQVLTQSEAKGNEKLQDYQKAKKAVVLNDNTNYSTAALCERAKEFGIVCK